MPGSDSTEVRTQIYALLEARDVQARRDIVLGLTRARILAAVVRQPEFRRVLDDIANDAFSPDDSVRAGALALMMRIAMTVRAARSAVEARIRELLQIPYPSLSSLADAGEREYLAQALCLASGPAAVEHLANEAVREEQAENAREILVRGLVAISPCLAEALKKMSSALKGIRFDTLEPEVSRARRLLRLLRALSGPVRDTDLELGERSGKQLADLAKVGELGVRDEPTLRSQLAEATLEATSDIIRLHFVAATNPETYAGALAVRAWFVPASWPDELHATLVRLGRQISGAIELLAKQGVADDRLRDVLVVILGEFAAKARLSRLSEELSGIDDDVRRWLSFGTSRTMRNTNAVVEEGVYSIADAIIGELLRTASRAERTFDLEGPDLAKVLEILDPPQAEAAGRIIAQARALAGLARTLAVQRNLRLRGEVGDEVDYSPHEHELGSRSVGSRRVRLRSPGVERSVTGQPLEIVLKADVEPV